MTLAQAQELIEFWREFPPTSPFPTGGLGMAAAPAEPPKRATRELVEGFVAQVNGALGRR